MTSEKRRIPKRETAFPRTIIVVVKCNRAKTFLYQELWKQHRAAMLSVPRPKTDERFVEEGEIWWGIITLNYVTHSQWWKQNSNWEMSGYQWTTSEKFLNQKLKTLEKQQIIVKKWSCWRLSWRLDSKFLLFKLKSFWQNFFKKNGVVSSAAV